MFGFINKKKKPEKEAEKKSKMSNLFTGMNVIKKKIIKKD